MGQIQKSNANSTEEHRWFQIVGANGHPALARLTNEELTRFPQLETDAAYRQGYVDRDGREPL